MAPPLTTARAAAPQGIGEPATLTIQATNVAVMSTNVLGRLNSLLNRVRISTQGEAVAAPAPPPDHLVWALELAGQNMNALHLLIDELERTL